MTYPLELTQAERERYLLMAEAARAEERAQWTAATGLDPGSYDVESFRSGGPVYQVPPQLRPPSWAPGRRPPYPALDDSRILHGGGPQARLLMALPVTALAP